MFIQKGLLKNDLFEFLGVEIVFVEEDGDDGEKKKGGDFPAIGVFVSREL